MDFFTLLGEGIKRENTGDERQRKSPPNKKNLLSRLFL